jgi:hypothetical protein
MTQKKNLKPSTENSKSTSSKPSEKLTVWQPPYTPPLSMTPDLYPRARALRERVKQSKFVSAVGPAVTGDRTAFGLPSPREFVPVPVPMTVSNLNQWGQRVLPEMITSAIPEAPKLNVGRKLKVLGGNQKPLPGSPDLPDIPSIDLLISFIEDAEELADGKRQSNLMEDIVKQFGVYLLYVDALETKVKNLKSAHEALLERQRGMILQ